MARQGRWAWCLLIGVALIGCGGQPEAPPGTGARECAEGYYAALIHQDWLKAYAALHRRDQRRCSLEQFSQLAQAYRGNLGFEPKAVHVRACDERDGEATAHVVLMGRVATRNQRYKDAATLHKGDDGWRVALPANFGRAKKK